MYVMWDRIRLDDRKVMEKPWEYVDRNTCENLESARAAEKEKMYETQVYAMRGQRRVFFASL